MPTPSLAPCSAWLPLFQRRDLITQVEPGDRSGGFELARVGLLTRDAGHSRWVSVAITQACKILMLQLLPLLPPSDSRF